MKALLIQLYLDLLSHPEPDKIRSEVAQAVDEFLASI